jgi:hypothetical protein
MIYSGSRYDSSKRSLAKFIVPERGDIVDFGIGLSYRPASLCSLAGRYDNPMLESTLSPQSGTVNLASGSRVSV